jgi:hypothetical protein
MCTLPRRFGMVILALLGLFASIPDAGADPFGHPNPGFLADSADHNYCFASGTSASHQSAARGSMGYLDDTTDMWDWEANSCGSMTDVVWVFGPAAADDGSPVRGRTYCVSWRSWGICEQYWLVVNPAEIFSNTATCGGGAANYDVNLVKTIRHELGHSTGLSHSTPGGCNNATGDDSMVSSHVSTDLKWTTYSTHHRDHVNAQY